MMAVALKERFPQYLAPTILVDSWMNVPRGNNWVVGGRFTKVNQGSRALRATVGLGAGGTKLESAVYVYDMSVDSTKPFLQFKTTGGSGAQPGALLSANPVSMAISGVGGAAKGLTDDVVRTSRMITADISEYMFAKGWIPEEQRIKAKR
ncbi:MAG: DUF4410 domain-containing protein [Verrucomicrobiota bacterium]